MQDVIFRITSLHFEFKILYLMYFLIVTVVFLAVTIEASLLSVYRIEVDKTAGEIVLTSLLRNTTIQSNQIANYLQTTHRNGIKEWNGLILRLTDHRKIQLAGQNIEDIPEFEQYLAEMKINCAGKETMKFPFS